MGLWSRIQSFFSGKDDKKLLPEGNTKEQNAENRVTYEDTYQSFVNSLRIAEEDIKDVEKKIENLNESPSQQHLNEIENREAVNLKNSSLKAAKKQKREEIYPNTKRLDDLFSTIEWDEFILEKGGEKQSNSGDALNYDKVKEACNETMQLRLKKYPDEKNNKRLQVSCNPASIFMPIFEQFEKYNCMYELDELPKSISDCYKQYKNLTEDEKTMVKSSSGVYGIAMGFYSAEECLRDTNSVYSVKSYMIDYLDREAKKVATEKGILNKLSPELKQYVPEKQDNDEQYTRE